MSLQGSVLSLLFILNSSFLFSCSIAFCIKWTSFDSLCGDQELIVSICALSSFIYGAVTLASMTSYIYYYSKSRCASMITIILTFSCGEFLFAVLAGSGMLISLYFGFDFTCLSDEMSKKDFVLLWLLSLFAIISNLIFVVLSGFNLFKKEERRKNNSQIYIIPDGFEKV